MKAVNELCFEANAASLRSQKPWGSWWSHSKAVSREKSHSGCFSVILSKNYGVFLLSKSRKYHLINLTHRLDFVSFNPKISFICEPNHASVSLRRKNGCILFGQILPIAAIVSTGDVSAGQGLLLLEKPRKILLLRKFFLLGWQSRAAEKKTRQTAVVSSVHRQAVFLIRLTIERAFAYLFYSTAVVSANFSGN